MTTETGMQPEQAVLGSVLLDPTALLEVSAALRPEDFTSLACSRIYAAMLAVSEQGAPLDLVTLLGEIERRGWLEQVGGRGYVVLLAEAAPSSIHAPAYASLVAQAATLRRLASAGTQIAGLATRPDAEAHHAVSAAEELLRTVTAGRAQAGFRALGDLLPDALTQIEALGDQRATGIGVPTGFVDLDKLLIGFQAGDLVVLGARPSMGKTALALAIAHHAALKGGKTVGFFSLEMSADQLVQRLLCLQGRLDSRRLRGGQIDAEEWERLVEAAAYLHEAPLYIDDQGALGVPDLRLRARRLQADHGLDLLVVDYLQLMSGSGRENRVQEVSAITRALKLLARELATPILALSQVSRAVENRAEHMPLLSDLRESGSIEQDADIVIFLTREEHYDPETDKRGIADVHVAKHRNGPTGLFSLYFDAQQARFGDLQPLRD